MSESTIVGYEPPLHHPKGFRARRGLNWGFIGLLYTSFYMCRYNFPIANSVIAKEYQWDNAQMGKIISATLFAYACGQILNGLLTDRIGGKKAMLIGAAGTVITNIAFGVASFAGTLTLFCTLWGINGYVQSFGAPGMVKMNTAWFNHRERGRFAGIFGFMINLGRFGINELAPMLVAGFSLFGLYHIAPLHWRWLFFTPAAICACVAVCMALIVKETPEEVGFQHLAHPDDRAPKTPGSPAGKSATRADFGIVLRTILTSPAVWITASAYFCTGVVRQSVDQWFPKYLDNVHHLDLKSAAFWWTGMLIPFVASAGSLLSGWASDAFFKSRRAPVAAALYLFECIIILCAAQYTDKNAAVFFLVAISFTANSTHSLLGTAAAMDIGGRKMSGFASGLIDSFQYFGGFLAGWVLGALIDFKGWGSYFYFMAPFALLGSLLMISSYWIKPRQKPTPLPVEPPSEL
jgi:MFS transporter, OPA family, glycerol-3-phosphate transporter